MNELHHFHAGNMFLKSLRNREHPLFCTPVLTVLQKNALLCQENSGTIKGEKMANVKRRKRSQKPKAKKPRKCHGFCKYFTKNGVTYYAEDYGYKAWPFGNPKK